MNDDKIKAAVQTFINLVHSVTASLVRMNPSSVKPVFLEDPGGGNLLASGVIVRWRGRLVLLSAAHALGNGSWALETRLIDPERREVLLYKLGPAHSAPKGDLAWAILDEAAMRATVPEAAQKRGAMLTLPYYQGPLELEPHAGEAYGFAAANNVELASVYGNPDLLRNGSYEIGMTFDGRLPDGRYRFKLGRKHRGDRYYFGASGAPIADPEGRIVSLVSAGTEADDVIYGVPLAELIVGI